MRPFLKYDYGLDQLVSLNNRPEGRSFFHLDALRSTVNLTDGSGSARQSILYDAWGNERDCVGTSANKFTFTGHEKDEETGLIYAKARFYDPDVGRFLSQDNFLGEVNSPPSLHRYSYAYQNPLLFVDPSGNQPQEIETEGELDGKKISFDLEVGQFEIKSPLEPQSIDYLNLLLNPGSRPIPRVVQERDTSLRVQASDVKLWMTLQEEAEKRNQIGRDETQVPVRAEDVAKSLFIHVGSEVLEAGELRAVYESGIDAIRDQAKAMIRQGVSPEEAFLWGSKQRELLQNTIRDESHPLAKALADKLKPRGSFDPLKKIQNKGAEKAIEGLGNPRGGGKWAFRLKVGGSVLIIASVGLAARDVLEAPSEERWRVLGKESGRTLGSIGGGYGGAKLGGFLGSSLGPGGAGAGAVIGGVLGSVGIGWLVAEGVEEVYEYTVPELE